MENYTSKPIDKFIPWFFVIFFVVLAFLLGDFVSIAIRTDPGVVTEDAYKKGLAYNQVIEQQQRQDKLGWQGDITVTKNVQQDAAIIFKLLDKNKKPVEKAQVQVTFIRPAQQKHDVKVDLISASAGLYSGKAALPFSGLWEAHVAVQRDKDSYQMTKRMTLP